MATAEIIAIGTELLLGHIVDTNTATIAKKLNEIGIDIYRTSLVGDNIKRISQLINESLSRSDIVVTTGGLGPTVDDPTRQAVADAMQTDLEFQPDLWDQIQARFLLFNRQPTENNKKQALIPRGAFAIENPVGTAPSFYCMQGKKIIISLPGVPAEMDYLLIQNVIPILQEHFPLKNITLSRIIHTAGIGESSLDEIIGEFETMANPTVGLAAHPGQVDIRVTAKAESREKAHVMIAPVEKKIRDLLGVKIYGIDHEKLVDKLQELVDAQNINTTLFYKNLTSNFIKKINQQGFFHSITEISESLAPIDSDTNYNLYKANSITIVQSFPRTDQCHLAMTFHLNNQEYYQEYFFAYQPSSCEPLIEFYLYNFMRESFIKEKGE